MQVYQDIQDIEEVRQLHFNFENAKCQEKCQVILQKKPYLFQVRTYYGFFLMYDDLNESLKQQLQVYQEAPYYFENTSYMLDNFIYFENKGRSLAQRIFKQYNDYQGEKNGFYYICIALLYLIQQDHEKSYEILISKLNDYDDQPMVQTWFYHQLGCHFQHKTNHGDDEENENVQKTLFFFEKALELQPRNTMNLQNLGVQYNCIATQEAREKSLQYYKKALDIFPENQYALCNFSSALVDLGYYDQSFQIFEKCLKNLKLNSSFFEIFLSLLLNEFDMIDIQNFDQIYREVCQGILTLIEIEPNNQSLFENFQHIQILSIKYSIQLEHMDLFEQIVSAFRKKDIISLIQLNKFIIEQQSTYLDGEEETKKYPVLKMTNILIQKELEISYKLLPFIAYKNIIQNNLHFQQSFSHWDLYVDY